MQKESTEAESRSAVAWAGWKGGLWGAGSLGVMLTVTRSITAHHAHAGHCTASSPQKAVEGKSVSSSAVGGATGAPTACAGGPK